MCGIAGFTRRSHTSDWATIKRLTASLQHRGPDQQDVFVSPYICLGAVRLKVIDLDGGDQPFASAAGSTVVVFNGEIYNHRELRQELESCGHRFRSHCDTEVLLEAFLEWDTQCFAKLRGMFAVALWTESDRRLVLARDRIGIKPLFILRRGSDLYFGSELKAILANPEVERRLDRTALEYYLCLNYVPAPLTLIRGIQKLPPGMWLEWRDGSVRSEPYWKLEAGGEISWTLDSAKEELDRLMTAAVREHLAADVGLGLWLSGGLDSSTILHYMAANSGKRLKTFSVSFRGRSFDETRHFREMAERYGTEHHEFDLNPGVNLPEAIQDLAYTADEPIADAGALPVWYLSRMCRQHITVALSGEGADELFGGYLAYRADSLARRAAVVPRGMRRLALRLLDRWPVSAEKVSLEYKAKRLLQGSLLDPDEAHCYWNGGLSPAECSMLMPSADHDGLAKLFRTMPSSWKADPLQRYLWFDQAYYLPDDILSKCDRMSMAHSLEVRPPFLDHRLVEFAASLPPRLKIRGTEQKYVLRQLMQRHLPAPILTRRKEGFDIPSGDWLRTALRPLLLDTLSSDAIASAGVFDVDRVQAMIQEHIDRRKNLGVPLWGLLILMLWIRRWQIETAPGTATEERPAFLAAALS